MRRKRVVLNAVRAPLDTHAHIDTHASTQAHTHTRRRTRVHAHAGIPAHDAPTPDIREESKSNEWVNPASTLRTIEGVLKLREGDILKKPGSSQLVLVSSLPIPTFTEFVLTECDAKGRTWNSVWWSMAPETLIASTYEKVSK